MRWIFGGQVEYTEFENDFLQEFLEECSKEKVALGSEWKKWDILRLGQVTKYKPEVCLKALKESIEWKKLKLPIQLTPAMESFLVTPSLSVQKG